LVNGEIVEIAIESSPKASKGAVSECGFLAEKKLFGCLPQWLDVGTPAFPIEEVIKFFAYFNKADIMEARTQFDISGFRVEGPPMAIEQADDIAYE